MSHTRTSDAEPATRDDVEAWFSGHGVPLFSESYELEHVALVMAALLAIVAAFELTVLPWLNVDALASLGVLIALTLVLLPLVPVFRLLWGRWRADDRRRLLRRRAWRATPLAIAVAAALSFGGPEIGWSGWIDFLVLSLLWLAAALSSRCKHVGAWQDATAGRSAVVFPLLLALTILAAYNLNSRPPLSTRLVDHLTRHVSAALYPAPASLALAPVAIGLLLWALAVRARSGTASPARRPVSRPADLIPALLVVLGVEATILPYLDAPATVTVATPLALGAVLPYVGGITASKRARALPDVPRPLGRATAVLGIVGFVPLLALVAWAGGSPLAPWQAVLVNLVYLVLALLIVGFGFDLIFEAMLKGAIKNVPDTLAALAKSLPVLVILLVFLSFTSDVWDVVGSLDRHRFLILLGGLVGLTFGVAIVRSLIDVARLRRFGKGWTDVVKVAPQGALRALADAAWRESNGTPAATGPVTVELRPAQFVNASLVMTSYQMIYVALVTIGMGAVFYAIGKLAIGARLLEDWGVKPLHGARTFDALSPLDQPWLRMALLLGLFSAFYFLVHFTQDSGAREEVMRGPDRELRCRLAVRAAYLQRHVPEGPERSVAEPAARALKRLLSRFD